MEQNNKSSKNAPEKYTTANNDNQTPNELAKGHANSPENPQPEPRNQGEESPQTPAADDLPSNPPLKDKSAPEESSDANGTIQQAKAADEAPENPDNPSHNGTTIEQRTSKSTPVKSIGAKDTIQHPKQADKAHDNPDDTQHEPRNPDEAETATPARENLPGTPPQARIVAENPPKRRRMNPLQSPFDGEELVLPPSAYF